MILILILAGVLGLYGLIVALLWNTKAGGVTISLAYFVHVLTAVSVNALQLRKKCVDRRRRWRKVGCRSWMRISGVFVIIISSRLWNLSFRNSNISLSAFSEVSKWWWSSSELASSRGMKDLCRMIDVQVSRVSERRGIENFYPQNFLPLLHPHYFPTRLFPSANVGVMGERRTKDFPTQREILHLSYSRRLYRLWQLPVNSTWLKDLLAPMLRHPDE